jgi:hypothetical protein
MLKMEKKEQFAKSHKEGRKKGKPQHLDNIYRDF